MREKIARALRRQFNIYHFDRSEDAGWEDELGAADAVLDALMEPSKEMVLAGRDAIPFPDATEGTYRAMIQAAKEGK